MAQKKYNPGKIAAILRQIEVEIANGKTTPQASREAGITEMVLKGHGFTECPNKSARARSLPWAQRRDARATPNRKSPPSEKEGWTGQGCSPKFRSS